MLASDVAQDGIALGDSVLAIHQVRKLGMKDRLNEQFLYPVEEKTCKWEQEGERSRVKKKVSRR